MVSLIRHISSWHKAMV